VIVSDVQHALAAEEVEGAAGAATTEEEVRGTAPSTPVSGEGGPDVAAMAVAACPSVNQSARDMDLLLQLQQQLAKRDQVIDKLHQEKREVARSRDQLEQALSDTLNRKLKSDEMKDGEIRKLKA
jgi:hypothetical protein